MFADLARRYRERGGGQEIMASLTMFLAMHTGQHERVPELYAAWRALPRDHFSDCQACVLDRQIEALLLLDRLDDAMAAFAPLDRRRVRCTEVPDRTSPQLLLPLLAADRKTEATRLLRRGYALIRGNRNYLRGIGQILVYFVVRKNLQSAVDYAERHLPWLFSVRDQDAQFVFLLGLWLTAAAAGRRQQVLTLRLPRQMGLGQEGTVCVEELINYCRRRTEALAAAFDRRNGNDHYRRTIDRQLDLL